MVAEKLLAEAEELIQQIHLAERDQKYVLHQQLHRLISEIALTGTAVPDALTALDLALLEEEAAVLLPQWAG